MRRDDLHGDGHVNNVFYLDYLQEARLDLLRHHEADVSPNPGEGLVVVRTVIDYLTPLSYRPAVSVETWVIEVRGASFTMGYELFTEPEDGGDRIVHARATTLLTPFVFDRGRPRRLTPEERAKLEPGMEPSPFPDVPKQAWLSPGKSAHLKQLRVRFSDIDVLGHVNNVRYMEYVQEAKTAMSTEVFRTARVDGTVRLVVARSEIDYVGQMNLRPEPYDVWTRVASIGTTSFVTEAEIRDGDAVMARSRSVMVSLDDDNQPVPLIEAHVEGFRRRM
jgi:acyl-CoA thioester hydrolase